MPLRAGSSAPDSAEPGVLPEGSVFEVVEQRGAIKDSKVAEFQVTIRIGFKLDH